ncbi:galactose mutarotase [Formicincola oecophyllae]|uniref:Aldose 1-epimerase n=1 Tax=Formicincola oecophyllae TaxID=2558361 RepID=A0A4Y6UBT3_9PROT|nr:aldose epimerase family protein [Formicincola oecophyllae]QDH14028.1 galactose mutarotase [Formicincola oecophyllae]
MTKPSTATTAWGTLPDGRPVSMVTLTNGDGLNGESITARIITWGGILQSVETPDANGKSADISLGFPNLEGYLAHNEDPHFGVILGRVANRIKGASFELDGATFKTPVNNGANTIHSGPGGFHAQLWTIEDTGADDSKAWLTLALTSPEGDMGFPGTVKVRATYTLTTKGELAVRFVGETDKPTLLNMATHAYWNLNGEGSGSAEPAQLRIDATRYAVMDEDCVPTGELAPVTGTPYDFTSFHTVGERLRSSLPQMYWAHGYDTSWEISGEWGRGKPVRRAATLYDPRSGRQLVVLTNAPAMQFYSCNWLNGAYVGPSGRTYRQTDGVAFEPGHYPDSIHRPEFPSVVLRPGETYDHTTVFRFSTGLPEGL